MRSALPVHYGTQRGTLAPSQAPLVGRPRRWVLPQGKQAQCSAAAGVGSTQTAE
jgi:hypothetical protein